MKRRKVIDKNPFTEAYIKELAEKNDVQGLKDFRKTLTDRQKLKLKDLKDEFILMGLNFLGAWLFCDEKEYLVASTMLLLGLIPLPLAVYNHSKRKKEVQEDIELVDKQIGHCNKRLVKETGNNHA